ncbi:MAG: HD domain-containing protein [Clostridia bacterium]|nr:HD domain-containing protein [Clostridia bacterium]
MHSNKNNVMIIDDDIGLTQALSIVLDSYNIKLSTFTEPLAAIQELRTNKHDILIVNYLMTSTRGDEIVKLVRDFDKEIYIILMSAHKDLAPSIDIMRSLDIQAFFEKGARFDDLILLIESGYKYIDQINEIKQMNHTIQNFGLELANTLKSTVGARDHYTKEHSDRVAEYAKLFGAHLELNEDELKTLVLAADFHDIGKIGISDAVLLKEGKLTDEEYAKIKLHPIISVNILAGSETFKDAIPAVRHHHERIDGRGYPDGLKGEQIPRLARILSICDTFDAITSRRVYREQMTIEDALLEIDRVKDAQLDKELAEIFIEYVRANPDTINKVMAKKQ